jgi:hypothetical protein
MPPVKYREVIAGKLSAAGWSWSYAALLPEVVDGGSLMRIKATANATVHRRVL